MFEIYEENEEKNIVRIKRKKNNPVAKSLSDRQFLPKIRPIKKIYNRKNEKRVDNYI